LDSLDHVFVDYSITQLLDCPIRLSTFLSQHGLDPRKIATHRLHFSGASSCPIDF